MSVSASTKPTSVSSAGFVPSQFTEERCEPETLVEKRKPMHSAESTVGSSICARLRDQSPHHIRRVVIVEGTRIEPERSGSQSAREQASPPVSMPQALFA